MASKEQRVPRLKDVAEAAGVSTAAASRILSGDRSEFSEATCQRVTETARKLGWRRNLLVKSIQQGKTKTIGVMIPPHDSFWVAVIAGIHIELARADYLPITVWVGDGRETPDFVRDGNAGVEQINRLLDRRVDGLILWPAFAAVYYQHYRELIEQRVPVVVIDHKLSEEELADSIETDEELGAQIVAKHLLGLGHKRIACLSAQETEWQSWSIRRRSLFQQAVADQAGLTVKSWTSKPGSLEAARAILQDPSRPTAVFAVTDHQAKMLYLAAKELGMRVPEDVSVVGYADLDFATELTPGLSTIRQRPIEVGAVAAKIILDRIDHHKEGEHSRVHRVPVDLVLRDSTAPPKE